VLRMDEAVDRLVQRDARADEDGADDRDSGEPLAAGAAEHEGDPAALLAAEEAHLTGFFGRIVDFYSRFMQRVLRRPVLLIGSSIAIVFLTYVCYHFLETDLLPAMDEGGFILDYFTPPGSSLTESDRILQHVEAILKHTRKWKTLHAAPACN